jgi:hypothetical protein
MRRPGRRRRRGTRRRRRRRGLVRNTAPWVDGVGGNVDGALRVPVPVVADVPVPADDAEFTARYRRVARAPVSAGAYPGRAVPASIARTPRWVGLSGSQAEPQTGESQAARHHHRRREPRCSIHGHSLREAPPRRRSRYRPQTCGRRLGEFLEAVRHYGLRTRTTDFQGFGSPSQPRV